MKRLFHPLSLSLAVAIAVVVTVRADGPPAVTRAIVELSSTKGNNVSGTVTFTKAEGGVRVVADVEGLTPGDHGFHIHEFGDCSAPDAASAGGHFNPTGHQHGAPGSGDHHAGDLGNLTADASGKAHFELVDPDLTFAGAESIIGRSVIVHAKADDLKSQPSGNSGPRVACGVIGVAKP